MPASKATRVRVLLSSSIRAAVRPTRGPVGLALPVPALEFVAAFEQRPQFFGRAIEQRQKIALGHRFRAQTGTAFCARALVHPPNPGL